MATRYLTALPTLPSFPGVSGEQTRERFGGPLPENGMREAALDMLEDVVAMPRPPSPRFYGYILGSGEPVAALGDLLASVLNQNVTAWRSSPAGAAIEKQVIGWLATAIGCSGFGGSLCGGASAANLMGLAMAREAKLPQSESGARAATVYASSEVHMSIPKAVALLGLGRESLRLVPTDAAYRMDVRALQAAIASPDRLRGLALADSLSLDPHKWLYQPVDCGALLYKSPVPARAAFSQTGAYARTFGSDPLEAFAYFEESMELSRRFRALKLWLSLRYHGAGAFRTAIRSDLHHACDLAGIIHNTQELELMAPAELSTVCFRYRCGTDDSDLDQINAAILKRLIERGRIYLSNASIAGRFALCACFVNHHTTDSDVAEIVPEVLAASRDVLGA